MQSQVKLVSGSCSWQWSCLAGAPSLHPAPSILHPAPCTQHPLLRLGAQQDHNGHGALHPGLALRPLLQSVLTPA